MPPDRKTHWERVYRDKPVTAVSWFEAEPRQSLDLVARTGIETTQPVIDVGGGASRLVDRMLGRGFRDITVLDISAGALEHARRRLGPDGTRVNWIVSDVLEFRPERRYSLWHDRAALHFLTDAADRQRYTTTLREGLAPGGWVILSAFGPEGPERCSGLEIVRYDAFGLGRLLGSSFTLHHEAIGMHATPMRTQQQFIHTLWQREA